MFREAFLLNRLHDTGSFLTGPSITLVLNCTLSVLVLFIVIYEVSKICRSKSPCTCPGCMIRVANDHYGDPSLPDGENTQDSDGAMGMDDVRGSVNAQGSYRYLQTQRIYTHDQSPQTDHDQVI